MTGFLIYLIVILQWNFIIYWVYFYEVLWFGLFVAVLGREYKNSAYRGA